MEIVPLGRTGLEVSRIGLGCMSFGDPRWRPWVLDEAASKPFFRRAVELGINFFDTADMYSIGVSEEVTGRALAELTRRDETVIATKVRFPMGDGPNMGRLGRKHIVQACEASLRRLGVEAIDLYQLHRFDGDVPMEETLGALDQLVRQGKVLYLGMSSTWAWKLMKALSLSERRGWARFVAMQNHYNLLYREEEREMMPLCLEEGLGVIPWSPLARGRLARPRSAAGGGRAESDAKLADQLYDARRDGAIIDAVEEVAEETGRSMAEVALAWVLAQPGVTAPIVGVTKLAHLEAAASATTLELTDEQLAKLEAPYVARAVTGWLDGPPRGASLGNRPKRESTT
jgi:aryl-alcohol dehydrogenase-like predicted oxidoreductase